MSTDALGVGQPESSRKKFKLDRDDCRILMTGLLAMGALTQTSVGGEKFGRVVLVIPKEAHLRFAEALAITSREPKLPEFGDSAEHQAFLERLNKRVTDLAELLNESCEWDAPTA